MSLLAQPARNRQSCQATYTVPVPSSCADGRSRLRMPPPSASTRGDATATLAFHDAPPLAEVNERIAPESLRNGTTTVPSGCTSGWPPSPCGVTAGLDGADQVAAPSVEVVITTRSLLLVMSH